MSSKISNAELSMFPTGEDIHTLVSALLISHQFSLNRTVFDTELEMNFMRTLNTRTLSRPSAMVFVDDDNHGASGNLSESPADSEFPASSALVCWGFFGDSAFHKKLSPWQIPMSVDLDDSIVDGQT